MTITLGKNSGIFHKLPNGRFGMLSWYPNAKPIKVTTNNGTADTAEDITEPETETATEETAAAS